MKNDLACCIIALLMFAISCASQTDDLKDIDGIMESNPARALEQLENVRPDELSPSDFDYYALLLTQAQIKNGIVVTSDSLMKYAYEAYRNSDSKDLKMRAYFYNGRIACDRGDMGQAMADAVVAYDIAKSEDDVRWIAESAELMSVIFFEFLNGQQTEAIEIECIKRYQRPEREGTAYEWLFDSAYFDNVIRPTCVMLMKVDRDYYVSKSQFEAHKSKTRLYALIAVIAVSIVIVILLVVIYRLKMRTRKAELEANISALSEKTQAIENLFKEKWGTLNMLCNEYFELGDSENTRDTLLARIENELVKLRQKKNLKDIEAAVDANMGGIMSLLRQECPFIKEDDFEFLSLVFAGLSVRAVCLFTGIKYNHFYLKKFRLSKRIAASEALHKDLFIEKLK